jgi:hypothetical protein
MTGAFQIGISFRLYFAPRSDLEAVSHFAYTLFHCLNMISVLGLELSQQVFTEERTDLRILTLQFEDH